MLKLGVTLKERAPDARGTLVDVGLSKVKPNFLEYIEWKHNFFPTLSLSYATCWFLDELESVR